MVRGFYQHIPLRAVKTTDSEVGTMTCHTGDLFLPPDPQAHCVTAT